MINFKFEWDIKIGRKFRIHFKCTNPKYGYLTINGWYMWESTDTQQLNKMSRLLRRVKDNSSFTWNMWREFTTIIWSAMEINNSTCLCYFDKWVQYKAWMERELWNI